MAWITREEYKKRVLQRDKLIEQKRKLEDYIVGLETRIRTYFKNVKRLAKEIESIENKIENIFN